MRFSAAPAGRLSEPNAPWAIFGDRPAMPDGLEDSALAGANLAAIGSSPQSPMFETASLLGAHLAAQPLDCAPGAPVVVFVHGFGYEPRRPVVARVRSDNPHRCLFHFDEHPDGPGSAGERRSRTTPWFARAMTPDGHGGAEDCEGLAVGYAWASRGGTDRPLPPGWLDRFLSRRGITRPWRGPAPAVASAYRDAGLAGFGLAALLTQLRHRLDSAGLGENPIDIFCHGLGARVALTALQTLARRWPGDRTVASIGRVLILSGACYWGQAASALADLARAGPVPGPSIYNVTSAADDVLHYLAARAPIREAVADAVRELGLDRRTARLLGTGRTIGRHGAPPRALCAAAGAPYAGWLDLALDGRGLRRWGRARGLDLRAGTRIGRGDHWTSLSHPGNWALWRAILCRAEGTAIPELAAALRTGATESRPAGCTSARTGPASTRTA